MGIEAIAAETTFTFARSSGPGGQNVNKVNSKAILYWDVTHTRLISEDIKSRFLNRFKNRITTEGILVLSADGSRDQKMNQRTCLEKLEQMLEDVRVPPKARKATRPTRASVERRIHAKKQRSARVRARREE